MVQELPQTNLVVVQRLVSLVSVRQRVMEKMRQVMAQEGVLVVVKLQVVEMDRPEL